MRFDAAKDCGAGWTYFRRTGGCYRVFATPGHLVGVAWSRARSSCLAQGGDLASVTDQTTNDFLARLTHHHVWIGADV